MSLINDALRRAGQAKKEQPPDASGGAPMQPVHPPTLSKNSFLGPLLLVVIALVMAVAGWFFWKGWQAKSKPDTVAKAQTPSSPTQPVLTAPIAVTETKVEPKIAVPTAIVQENKRDSASVAVAANIPPPTPSSAVVVESKNTVATESSTNTAVTVVTSTPSAAPTPLDLKLQGIFYRITNPTALINGKTVSAGEEVAGARVVKIDRQEVTVEWNGQTNVLTMR